MSFVKAVVPHLVFTAVAGALAFAVATRDEKPALASRKQDVEVWGGKASAIQKISFKSDKLEVVADSHTDAQGRWYSGSVIKTTLPPPAASGSAAASAPPPEAKKETIPFVGVTQIGKLADSLAPLLALREVGKIDDARAEEFGFDKPEGTLEVNVGGTLHTLVLGGVTPGGEDRYAKAETGVVYAISGEVARGVLFADSRLVERELHEWKIEDAARAKVTRDDKSRELTRIEDKKDGWADLASPSTQDETAGNWMSKLHKVRVNQYLEKPAAEPTLVVRVEYSKAGKVLGFIELGKLAGADGKPDYVVRSEQTRWWATVVRSTAEPVEQDVGSVLK